MEMATFPITATYVKRAAAKGQLIIVVDPKWTPLVRYSTVWLQPKLGADIALLNGLVHIIIKNGWIDRRFIEERVEGGMEAFSDLEELVTRYTPEFVSGITGVPAENLNLAARLYATSPTAMIATGMGMSQQVTGTHNVFCLINMMLVTGQVGRERCGINPPRGQNNVQGVTDVGCSPVNCPGYIPVTDDDNRRKVAKVWDVPYESLSPRPGLTTVEIMQAAYKGKIKGIFIMGENPMISDPNLNHTEEALNRMEFVVVQDIFLTETTRLADVVLPASAWGEKEGTFVNSDRRVLRARKAVECPGTARIDWRVIHELSRRMGKPMPDYRDESEIFDEIARVTPIMAGISYSRLEEGSIQWPCPTNDHPGTPTLYLERFNTPTGRGRLFPVDYVPQNEFTDSEYPLMLNSGRVKVESRRGELETQVRISEEVLIGEVFMPWHFTESQVNRLTRDELDPYSRIAPFKLSAVRIHKI